MGRPSNITVITEHYKTLSNELQTYLQQLGYVKASSRAAYLHIQEFFNHLEKEGTQNIQEVNTQHIEQYHEYLRQRTNKKDGTTLREKSIYSHLRAMQHLFDMLQMRGEITLHPMNMYVIPYPQDETERTILTPAEIAQLYRHCTNYQERSILSLAYGCGLRVGEIEKCNVEDVQFKENILIVPEGKGKKRRVIPMSKGVMKDLLHYLNKERIPPTDQKENKKPIHKQSFIIHIKGGRMREYTYNKLLKQIAARTNNEAFTTKQMSIHILRHSIATHLLENGMSVEQVRQFLGHSQLETTETYTHISQQQLKKLAE